MGGLFGKPKITNHDRAVLDLKNQRDKLRVYSKKLEQIIEKDSENIKQLLKDGKRDKALLTLKRKKYQEKLLSKNKALLDNLQEMVDNIAFAKLEVKVFQGLREGAKILKEIHQQIDLGELENIMIDTEEGIQKQKEIDELLGSRLTEEDEEDILKELQALQLEEGGGDLEVEEGEGKGEGEGEVGQKEIEESQKEISSDEEVDLQLPNVPTTPLVSSIDEKELEEEEEERAMSHGKQSVLA